MRRLHDGDWSNRQGRHQGALRVEHTSPAASLDQQVRFDQTTVRPLGADHALMTGRFTLSGGGQPDRSGWFSLVWKRTPSGWRILHDHSS